MAAPKIFSAHKIFDGFKTHTNAALMVDAGRVLDVVPTDQIPHNAVHTWEEPADWIVPGFVDLQVNGGGGVLFNDSPTLESIKTICAAHARFGTTSLMPTLISDSPEVTAQALESACLAHKDDLKGYLGLHLEGPHLSTTRHGAHEKEHIRSLTAESLDALVAAAPEIGHALITVAPESVTPEQISCLKSYGWHVSLGHSDCTADAALESFEAGATMVTHLFNAMSQMSGRSPGLVGAALATNHVSCGVIADGHHVDPTSIAAAVRAKSGPGHLFLVTDAMSPTGTDQNTFQLNGRTIQRSGGRLTLEDGTLAGADIDMLSAVKNMVQLVGVSLEEALKMASLYPAEAVGVRQKGRLTCGADADFVKIKEIFEVQSSWYKGECVYDCLL